MVLAVARAVVVGAGSKVTQGLLAFAWAGSTVTGLLAFSGAGSKVTQGLLAFAGSGSTIARTGWWLFLCYIWHHY